MPVSMVFDEAFELDALFVQFADQIDQILDAAAQAIQFPDDKGITLTQHFQRFGQALEHLLAPGLDQGSPLQLKVLILRRDTCVADQHGFLASQLQRQHA